MMLAGLLLAVQLAAPAPITARGPAGETTVPVVERAGAPYVHAERLAPAVRTTVRRTPDGRITLTLADLEIELADRVPFARIRGEVLPLAAPTRVERDVVLVPLHLLSDLAPRRTGALTYDVSRRELRDTGAATVVAAGSIWEAAAGGPSVPPAAGSTAPPSVPGPSAPAPAPSPEVSSSARTPPAETRSPSTGSPATRPSTAPKRQRVVVIDPGHGGTDPGTTGRTTGGRVVLEKEIALDVALRLRDSLSRRGVRVVLTRDRDTLIALSDRGRIANAHNGDLFLSIHVNSSNPRARDRALVRGAETYFLAEARTEDARRVEQMENEVVRFETAAQTGRDDPLGFILNDMAQNEHLRESSDLAAVVQQHLAAMHPGPDRGVKQAGFRVLMTTFMPAVLIEIGFASNTQEATFLVDARRQGEIARSIALATMEYLEHYERRIGGLAP